MLDVEDEVLRALPKAVFAGVADVAKAEHVESHGNRMLGPASDLQSTGSARHVFYQYAHGEGFVQITLASDDLRRGSFAKAVATYVGT